ncbi:radical SAM family protein [Oleiphilus messinensis]|uniref:Radical SAM family protein n=1 Tax=Oleiphilus messinensis TaxID=141451 RepID=A0A1Y0I8R5_9GAMM|nr:radical SAM protein [Oleiphilus messinensis]ARU56902.1 radical SAM family protein [Oleiphilus messinensis]
MSSLQHDFGFDSSKEEAFPNYIMYDIVNVCNATCPHCPQSLIASDKNYKPLYLQWDVYEKSIKEVAQYKTELVRFTGDGEPLIHPRLPEMIKKAKSLGIPKVNLTTNGSLLSGRKLDNLLECPPDIFDVSLDAYHPETFSVRRGGLNFDEVKKNVINLTKLAPQNNFKVIVSFINEPGLESEVERFKAFWKDRVDFVAVRSMHSNLGLSGLGSTDKSNLSKLQRWPCQHLWRRLVIDYRGHIRYCPVDWLDQTSLGAVSAMSLHEAWHSDRLRQLRTQHTMLAFDSESPCANCSDWSSSPWNVGWMQMIKTYLDNN